MIININFTDLNLPTSLIPMPAHKVWPHYIYLDPFGIFVDKDQLNLVHNICQLEQILLQ